jgi:hypothetical protein
MKKFNLEKALAGEPVVTRDGQKVTQLTLFEINDQYPLRGVINMILLRFPKEGIFDLSLKNHPLDLFMAPEKKSVWVNVYEKENGEFELGMQHTTLQRATNNIRGNENYIKTIEITNEP